MKDLKQSPYQKMFLVTPMVYEKLKQCLNKCEKDDIIKLNKRYEPVRTDQSNQGIRNISTSEINPDNDDRPDTDGMQLQNSNIERMEPDEGVGDFGNNLEYLPPSSDFLRDIYGDDDSSESDTDLQIPIKPTKKLGFSSVEKVDIPPELNKNKVLSLNKRDQIDIPGLIKKPQNLGLKKTGEVNIPGEKLKEKSSTPTQTDNIVALRKKPTLIYRRPIQEENLSESFNPVFHSTPIRVKKRKTYNPGMTTLEESEPLVETPSMLDNKKVKKRLTPLPKKVLKEMEKGYSDNKSFSWSNVTPLEERIHEMSVNESPKKAISHKKLLPLTYELPIDESPKKGNRFKKLLPLTYEQKKLLKSHYEKEPNLKDPKQSQIFRPVMGKKGLLQYQCDLCGKLFSRKYSVQRHKKSFHEVKRLEYIPTVSPDETTPTKLIDPIPLKYEPTKKLALTYKGPIFNPNILKRTYERKFKKYKGSSKKPVRAVTYEPDVSENEDEMENVQLEVPLKGPIPPQDEFMTDYETEGEDMPLAEVRRRQLLNKPYSWKRYQSKMLEVPRRAKEIKMRDNIKKQFDSWDISQFK